MKDKAILVVSFGTSYKETRRKTLDALTERVAKEFPDREVRQAFTSKMIIRIMEKRDGIKVDYITDGLRRLREDGFKDVIVLPTHIIPGYEYDDVREAVSEFRGCFDSVRMGAAMFSCTDDFDIIIDALKGAYVGRCMGSDPEGKAIVFMGHGSDHFANSCYSELQLRLRSKGIDNVFITTVEGFPSTEDTMGMIKDGGFSKVYLIPFLLGTDIDEVAAFVATMDKKNEKGKPITVDDNAVCILKMTNGVIGQLTASWTFYGGEDNSTTIIGTKGRMVLGANPDFQVEVFGADGTQSLYKVGAVATNTVQVSSGIPDLFVQCILNDMEPPFDGLKGYKALAAVVACRECAQTGKITKVQNVPPKVKIDVPSCVRGAKSTTKRTSKKK